MHELESIARHRSGDFACIYVRAANCKLLLDSYRSYLPALNHVYDDRNETRSGYTKEVIRMPGMQFVVQRRRVGEKVRDMVQRTSKL